MILSRRNSITIGILALVVVFGLGFLSGRYSQQSLGRVRILDYGSRSSLSSAPTAMTGAVIKVADGRMEVTADGQIEPVVFRFIKTTLTTVVRLVPREQTNRKDPLAFVFPYQSEPAAFSDIKVGDRVYVQASEAVTAGKELEAVEVKIQPK